MSPVFLVKTNAVASEIIDGEAIIMQLQTGLYFSCRGSGAAVWELLGRGVSLDAAAAALAGAYSVDTATVRHELETFARSAESHELGELVEGSTTAADLPELSVQGPWQAPVLEVFSDMQDLLLLDPIHDVSAESGWPLQKPV